MNSNMPLYYKCNMTKTHHAIAYVVCSIAVMVIAFLFYHLVLVSVVIGVIAGFFLEKLYAASTITKRQKELRLQFKEFLKSMSVAVGAGNVEIQAVKSALKDLRLSYSSNSDIVIEVENIIKQYEMGGIQLKVLFEDLANRSELEDVRSFATIYSVIEGKSDRFGDILRETEQIISDKIEIEQEIETTITSAKSETMTMLVMPIIIVIAMSAMGSGLTDSLFNTLIGHVAATAALIIFAVSFVLAVKSTDIEV